MNLILKRCQLLQKLILHPSCPQVLHGIVFQDVFLVSQLFKFVDNEFEVTSYDVHGVFTIFFIAVYRIRFIVGLILVDGASTGK